MSFDRIIYRLTDKRIPAATGIGLVGDILDRAGFQEQFCNVRSEDKRSRKQIDSGAVMTSLLNDDVLDFRYACEGIFQYVDKSTVV